MVDVDEPISHHTEVMLLVWTDWGEAIGCRYIKGGCDAANRQGENEGRCDFKGAPSGGEIVGVDAVVHRKYFWAVVREGHVLNHTESA